MVSLSQVQFLQCKHTFSWQQSMQAQSWPFGALEDRGMPTKRRILNISALRLLAQSVRLLSFCRDFTIHKLSSVLYASQVYSFNHGLNSVRPLELKGVTSVVDCVKCVSLPVKKICTG